MIKTAQAVAAATKIETRLRQQGRGEWEARTDAANWVGENFNMFMGFEGGVWVVLAPCCADGQCDECCPIIEDWDD